MDKLQFHCLGGGNEVGRSCHIIECHGKVIMLDAGVHPGFSGTDSLPFFDDYDLAKVDILLISHFHLDHAAALPYVLQHTNFKGRVFMTYPTKAIYKWLLNDFVRVTSITTDDGDEEGEGDEGIYSDEDLAKSLDRIETIDYHSTMEVDGIRFTAYHAGHVLGAAMFLIEMGGLKVMFTGDYSREEDRHLASAEVPPLRPDVLITESTFGTATHVPREEREQKLTNLIHTTINQGGRCLLPVFALGRAQEILLILDEYWESNQDLHKVPIYYASDLAKKCMAVYQRYIYMMNSTIRAKFNETNVNPFVFKYIKNITHMNKMNDQNSCVIIASPGMLQNGISRKVLEKWSPDPTNAVIMTGYSIEGTMAKQLLTEPLEIPSINNQDMMIPRRINVEEISFAAHVDYEQNSQFIEQVNPKTIILVHGESNPMGRLKSALLSKYKHLKNTKDEVKIFNPRNSTTLELEFKGDKVVKVVGQLAMETAKRGPQLKSENEEEGEKEEGQEEEEEEDFKGVIVQKDFDLNVMKVDDVREFTNLTTTVVKQKQILRCNANRNLVQWQLSQMFGFNTIDVDSKPTVKFDIMDIVNVELNEEKGLAYVEWESGMMEDTVADSVIAILLSCDSSLSSVKLTTHQHSHDHEHGSAEPAEPRAEPADVKQELIDIKHEIKQELKREPVSSLEEICSILETQFGSSFRHDAGSNSGVVKIGKNEATIHYDGFRVDCTSNVLRGRVEGVLNLAVGLVSPLSIASKKEVSN